jgi:outer membrane protein OmpA-like peptidoglycan-associated protein
MRGMVSHRDVPISCRPVSPGGWLGGVAIVIAVFWLLAGSVGCKKKAPAANTEAAQQSSGSSAPQASDDGRPSDQSAQVNGGKDQAGSLAARLNAVESGDADKPGKAILPVLKPYPVGTTPTNIPLIKGLIIDGVLAPNQKPQDSDHSVSIDAVTPTSVVVTRGKDRGAQAGGAVGKDGKKASPGCKITVDKVDLGQTNNYRPFVCLNKDEHFPGTNPLGASVDVLAQLKAGKQVEFQFNPDSDMTGELSNVMQMLGPKSDAPKVSLRAGIEMYGCNLHRVEPFDLTWSVLVNSQPVDLPALHAMCTYEDGEETHLYFLDQADNPLTLYADFGVVPEKEALFTITLPSEEDIKLAQAAASQMEKDLEAKKPVEIYGIYFDFNSAAIKPESEVVLKQIAGILQKNPDWKLNVSGHTDNIGDAATNLPLSQKRAAAVKDALVTRYKIAPDRLATDGFGASRPIADNSTMIGRAKNRRVELQRE